MERFLASQGEIAATLHKAFIPKLPSVPLVELSAKYLPASKDAMIGGDWYDAIEMPDGRILFSIGDVMGHGEQAAVSMSRARQTLLTLAHFETSPATILEKASRVLFAQHQPMTSAMCGFFLPYSGSIVYANAGHPPLIAVRHASGVELLPSSGPPLGTFDDAVYADETLDAHEGDMLVLYTDGVTEEDRDIDRGELRLLECIRSAAAVPPAGRAEHIAQHIFGETSPRDDAAILVLSFGKRAA